MTTILEMAENIAWLLADLHEHAPESLAKLLNADTALTDKLLGQLIDLWIETHIGDGSVLDQIYDLHLDEDVLSMDALTAVDMLKDARKSGLDQIAVDQLGRILSALAAGHDLTLYPRTGGYDEIDNDLAAGTMLDAVIFEQPAYYIGGVDLPRLAGYLGETDSLKQYMALQISWSRSLGHTVQTFAAWLPTKPFATHFEDWSEHDLRSQAARYPLFAYLAPELWVPGLEDENPFLGRFMRDSYGSYDTWRLEEIADLQGFLDTTKAIQAVDIPLWDYAGSLLEWLSIWPGVASIMPPLQRDPALFKEFTGEEEERRPRTLMAVWADGDPQ